MAEQKRELYERAYLRSGHFSFGENWLAFQETIDQSSLERAQRSLIDFLGGPGAIKDRDVIDVGCGSGLFSLAFHTLGANSVTSVDIDRYSLAATRKLRHLAGNPANWQVVKASALDPGLDKRLGQFDLVYSWGVLHHTGDMYRALGNITKLGKKNTRFYLAIYGKGTGKVFGNSYLWLRIKKLYNRVGVIGKRLMVLFYKVSFFALCLLRGQNPWRIIGSYRSHRGMDWHTDIVDWLGGYPYEFASPDEISQFLKQRGLSPLKVHNPGGISCVEYLFAASGSKGGE